MVRPQRTASARRRLALSLSLVTVCLALAAPAQAGDTEPLMFRPKGLSTNRFDVAGQPQSVTIKAHDGIDLFMWIYRPDTRRDRRWRTPVILAASPYFGQSPPTSGYLFRLVSYFTPKGYAVAFSHVRGTARSGGCLEQDGINQQLDFKTVVEYLASQGWSNGKVGSYGISYDGETQNAGAIRAPRGLATIIPMEAISSLYDTVYFDGVPLYVGNQTVAAGYGVDTLTPGNTHYPERPWCQPEQISNNLNPSGTETPYFVERDFRRHVQDLRASVLYVEGFGDTNVLPNNIVGWYDRIPTFKRAIFGQWNHEVPDDNVTHHGRKDWFDIVHSWFDHELLGLPTGVEKWPAVQAQDQFNVWRAARSFADLGREQRLPLGFEVIGRREARGAHVGFEELTAASWVGPVLKHPLHLSGEVSLDATMALDRPDAHFILHVEEVRPDGSSRILTAGYLSAPHRDSLTNPTPVPIGVPIGYHIRTFPTDVTLAAGSALRITLSGIELESNEIGFNQGIPAGTLYHADVFVDGRTSLVIPVVGRVCGMDVRPSEPLKVPVPGCG